MSLLTKTRALNVLLQKEAGHAVNFMDISRVLGEVVDCNVYVISRKGKILGYSMDPGIEPEDIQSMVSEDRRIPNQYNDLLFKIVETTPNMDKEVVFNRFQTELNSVFEGLFVTVVPVIGAGARLGTLVLTRKNNRFVDDDLILAEYGATVVAIEIVRMRAEESELEARSKAVVQVAVGSLSFSELEAVDHIFEELDGKEGLLVASKIADRVGITRSVIVNALRKLESAGVIETRSLGMKGTYIRILNDQLIQALQQTKL